MCGHNNFAHLTDPTVFHEIHVSIFFPAVWFTFPTLCGYIYTRTTHTPHPARNNTVAWHDIRCSVRRCRSKFGILHGIHGSAKSSEMVAIVGKEMLMLLLYMMVCAALAGVRCLHSCGGWHCLLLAKKGRVERASPAFWTSFLVARPLGRIVVPSTSIRVQ